MATCGITGCEQEATKYYKVDNTYTPICTQCSTAFWLGIRTVQREDRPYVIGDPLTKLMQEIRDQLNDRLINKDLPFIAEVLDDDTIAVSPGRIGIRHPSEFDIYNIVARMELCSDQRWETTRTDDGRMTRRNKNLKTAIEWMYASLDRLNRRAY